MTENVKISIRMNCKWKEQLWDALIVSLLNRMQIVEKGSTRCDYQTFGDLNSRFSNELSMESNVTYLQAFDRFSSVEWLQNQSFCYERRQFAILSPMVYFIGICYSFNLDEEYIDRTTLVIRVSGKSS